MEAVDSLSQERENWPSSYRRVVEYFEKTEDPSEFEHGGRYPDEYDPYTLHESIQYPLHEDDERDRPWHILFNPWDGSERTAWIMDGKPLKHEETVMGADDPQNDMIATDDDLIDIGAGQVYVCVALTKVAQIHSRAENWILTDDRIEKQFVEVLDTLEDNVS